MEPLFINDYVPEKEDMREFAQASIRRFPQVLFWLLAAWFAVLGGLYCSSVIRSGLHFLPPMLLCIAIMLVCLLIMPLRKHRYLRRLIRQELLMGGGQYRRRSVSFYEDHLKLNTSSTEFRYEQISKVRETPGFILLIVDKTIGIMLRKDAFTKGDLTSFLMFLHGKGISLSPQKPSPM